MKKLYFLARLKPGENDVFAYCKGELFESEIPGLALVRMDENKELTFKGMFSIIDIRSGLFVMRDTSKKKLLEHYNARLSADFIEAINKARSTESYRERVRELQIEIDNWRKSGYSVYYGDM